MIAARVRDYAAIVEKLDVRYEELRRAQSLQRRENGATMSPRPETPVSKQRAVEELPVLKTHAVAGQTSATEQTTTKKLPAPATLVVGEFDIELHDAGANLLSASTIAPTPTSNQVKVDSQNPISAVAPPDKLTMPRAASNEKVLGGLLGPSSRRASSASRDGVAVAVIRAIESAQTNLKRGPTRTSSAQAIGKPATSSPLDIDRKQTPDAGPAVQTQAVLAPESVSADIASSSSAAQTSAPIIKSLINVEPMSATQLNAWSDKDLLDLIRFTTFLSSSPYHTFEAAKVTEAAREASTGRSAEEFLRASRALADRLDLVTLFPKQKHPLALNLLRNALRAEESISSGASQITTATQHPIESTEAIEGSKAMPDPAVSTVLPEARSASVIPVVDVASSLQGPAHMIQGKPITQLQDSIPTANAIQRPASEPRAIVSSASVDNAHGPSMPQAPAPAPSLNSASTGLAPLKAGSTSLRQALAKDAVSSKSNPMLAPLPAVSTDTTSAKAMPIAPSQFMAMPTEQIWHSGIVQRQAGQVTLRGGLSLNSPAGQAQAQALVRRESMTQPSQQFQALQHTQQYHQYQLSHQQQQQQHQSSPQASQSAFMTEAPDSLRQTLICRRQRVAELEQLCFNLRTLVLERSANSDLFDDATRQQHFNDSHGVLSALSVALEELNQLLREVGQPEVSSVFLSKPTDQRAVGKLIEAPPSPVNQQPQQYVQHQQRMQLNPYQETSSQHNAQQQHYALQTIKKRPAPEMLPAASSMAQTFQESTFENWPVSSMAQQAQKMVGSQAFTNNARQAAQQSQQGRKLSVRSAPPPACFSPLWFKLHELIMQFERQYFDDLRNRGYDQNDCRKMIISRRRDANAYVKMGIPADWHATYWRQIFMLDHDQKQRLYSLQPVATGSTDLSGAPSAKALPPLSGSERRSSANAGEEVTSHLNARAPVVQQDRAEPAEVPTRKTEQASVSSVEDFTQKADQATALQPTAQMPMPQQEYAKEGQLEHVDSVETVQLATEELSSTTTTEVQPAKIAALDGHQAETAAAASNAPHGRDAVNPIASSEKQKMEPLEPSENQQTSQAVKVEQNAPSETAVREEPASPRLQRSLKRSQSPALFPVEKKQKGNVQVPVMPEHVMGSSAPLNAPFRPQPVVNVQTQNMNTPSPSVDSSSPRKRYLSTETVTMPASPLARSASLNGMGSAQPIRIDTAPLQAVLAAQVPTEEISEYFNICREAASEAERQYGIDALHEFLWQLPEFAEEARRHTTGVRIYLKHRRMQAALLARLLRQQEGPPDVVRKLSDEERLWRQLFVLYQALSGGSTS